MGHRRIRKWEVAALAVTGLLAHCSHGIQVQDSGQEPVAISGHIARESTWRVNINTADAETLTALPGIGPALAERIIAYRETNGGFETIEELMEVSGIGEATFAQLAAYITI